MRARSFAAPTTKTPSFFSCSQVRNEAKRRCDSPPSASEDVPEAKAFSISSIHSTTGAIASATVGRAAEVLLRLADVLFVQPSGVELEQRQLPLPGDELRGERLAAALHADEQHAFRRREIHRLRLGREADARVLEPLLQSRESAQLERGSSPAGKNSRMPPRSMISPFQRTTRSMSSGESCPSSRMACAITRRV